MPAHLQPLRMTPAWLMTPAPGPRPPPHSRPHPRPHPVTRRPSPPPELAAFMEITFLHCRRRSRRCRCCYSSKCKYFSFLLRKLSNVFKNVRRMRNLSEYVCVRLCPCSLFGFRCKSEMQGF